MYETDLFYQGAAFAEDKLVYHSPPLKENLEILGQVKFRAFIELNVPDTDLAMFLFEIRADGKSIPLARDMLRARWRDSLTQPKLITPGKVYEYVFDNSFFFARRIKKGSRLRLIVNCVNSPAFEKNYNSGGVVSEETAKDARTAVVKLYHSAKYPSALELPIAVEVERDKK